MQWIGLNIIMRKNETCRAARYSLRSAFHLPVGRRHSLPLAPSFPDDSFLPPTPDDRLQHPSPRSVEAVLVRSETEVSKVWPLPDAVRHRLRREECIFHILTILPLPVPSAVLIGLENAGGREGRKKSCATTRREFKENRAARVAGSARYISEE